MMRARASTLLRFCVDAAPVIQTPARNACNTRMRTQHTSHMQTQNARRACVRSGVRAEYDSRWTASAANRPPMMLSNEAAENPRLHDAHHVWLPYCTGDTWQFIVRPIKARRGHGMRRPHDDYNKAWAR